MRSRSFKDANERRGFHYLLSLGFADSVVEYEPSGEGKAPDFGLPNGIAVEVTALVEHTRTDGNPESLATGRKSIARRFEKFLRSYIPPSRSLDQGWMVSFSFRRPLRKWRELEPLLKAALDAFISDGKESARLRVTPEFELRLTRAIRARDQHLRHAGYIDRETLGWDQASLEFNVPVALARKATVLKSLENYRERWLVLVDNISYGAWEQLQIDSRLGWDRVIFLTPEGPLRACEPALKRLPTHFS